jgi:hypothetical protein
VLAAPPARCYTSRMNDIDPDNPAEEAAGADPDALLDPVARSLLGVLAAAKPGGSVAPEAVARVIGSERARPSDGPNAWRRYLPAVKQQALHLARQGRVEIVRKGKVVDLADFKGVVRYRLPAGDAG